MKILYISILSSERLIDEIHKRTGKNPGYAVQKFSRLLVKGLMANGVDVTALSNPPITRSNSSSCFVRYGKVVENDIRYQYIPFINAPVLKHLCVFFYTFFYVLIWGLKNRKDKSIICDVLNVSACMGSLLASKINRVKSIGVVTDIPDYASINDNSSDKKSLSSKVNNMFIISYDGYVLLTEAMNEVVNRNKRPYIVMEGLVDNKPSYPEDDEKNKDKKIVLYAGGLNRIYGIGTLVDAFRQIGSDDIQLSLYGSGGYEKELREICRIDSRVKFFGVKPNEVIVKAEKEATILVNPRPTTEEFTKFSFPSKNMEYMVSGTPLLTTKLPGIPNEYYSFIYTIWEETVKGYKEALEHVLSLSQNELDEFGRQARDFVLMKKNNKVQASRIIKLIECI